ncbi:MAG TPA: hypothetical protein VFH47_01675, partial [Candidatus Thermoplasmatota archaeon]|nr:hypothetical protein [Candidatus Thermoplasmatota archaeon]
VFLAQAAPLYQVVLGAPVFEELLKAGLGMLLALGVAARGPWRWAARAAATVALAATAGAAAFAAAGTVAGVAAGPASALAAGCAFLAATVAAATWGPSRTRRTSSCTPQRLGVEGGDAEAAGAPRVPLALAALCGLAVGFGFGVLEHVLTYASEPRPLAWLRVTFHAASGGLSLACWSAAVRAGEDARRLAVVATAPATVLHYLNNAGAVVLLLLAPLAPGAGAAATGLSAAVVAATVLAAGAACASLTLARRMLAPAARLLPAGAGRAARAPPRSG